MSYKLHANLETGAGKNRTVSARAVGGAKTLDEAKKKAASALESEGSDCVSVAILDESGAEVDVVKREDDE